jgi:hypothetical protein
MRIEKAPVSGWDQRTSGLQCNFQGMPLRTLSDHAGGILSGADLGQTVTEGFCLQVSADLVSFA